MKTGSTSHHHADVHPSCSWRIPFHAGIRGATQSESKQVLPPHHAETQTDPR